MAARHAHHPPSPSGYNVHCTTASGSHSRRQQHASRGYRSANRYASHGTAHIPPLCPSYASEIHPHSRYHSDTSSYCIHCKWASPRLLSVAFPAQPTASFLQTQTRPSPYPTPFAAHSKHRHDPQESGPAARASAAMGPSRLLMLQQRLRAGTHRRWSSCGGAASSRTTRGVVRWRMTRQQQRQLQALCNGRPTVGGWLKVYRGRAFWAGIVAD